MSSSESSSSSFVREVPCSGGAVLKIKQLYVGDVGCVVWDAALILAKFLENGLHFESDFWKERKVIDIGSGTGVVGLAAGVLGAHVLVTDLPEFVDLMSCNVELNSHVITGCVGAEELSWGKPLSEAVNNHGADVVLMSDVVYYEESLQDLVSTVLSLCCQSSIVLMAYEERTTGNKPEVEREFFSLMARHFKKTVVAYSDLDQVWRSPDIHVVKFTLLST